MQKSKIIVALDDVMPAKAQELIELLAGEVGGFKANSLLDWATPSQIVRWIKDVSPNSFFMSDPKFYDIDRTTGNRVKAHAVSGARFITMHMSGGERIVKAAVSTVAKVAENQGALAIPATIVGVSILTSLELGDLRNAGLTLSISSSIERIVSAMYENAYDWGVRGFVCSGKELSALALIDESFAPGMRITKIVPGVRSKGADAQDQKRVITPKEAVTMGADYVVVGSEIMTSPDPLGAAKRINDDIG